MTTVEESQSAMPPPNPMLRALHYGSEARGQRASHSCHQSQARGREATHAPPCRASPRLQGRPARSARRTREGAARRGGRRLPTALSSRCRRCSSSSRRAGPQSHRHHRCRQPLLLLLQHVDFCTAHAATAAQRCTARAGDVDATRRRRAAAAAAAARTPLRVSFSLHDKEVTVEHRRQPHGRRRQASRPHGELAERSCRRASSRRSATTCCLSTTFLSNESQPLGETAVHCAVPRQGRAPTRRARHQSPCTNSLCSRCRPSPASTRCTSRTAWLRGGATFAR
jgi:hypothetical protein